MVMIYIVQKNVFRESNYDKIFEALDRLGLEYEVVDLTDKLICETERKDVFPFGSVKLARLSAEMDWQPGSFYGGNHDYNVYSKFYQENLLNYDSVIQEVGESLDWFPGEMKFIRPCKDSKAFTGALFTKIKWEDLVERSQLPDSKSIIKLDTQIQISSPKLIYKEARVWIIDGKIVTQSYYRFNSNIQWSEDVDPEGLDFAQQMADLYQPAEAFVMDICLTPDDWKIVEINCINCAGFYQGDLQKIIIALENKYNP
jgi:hypothetical protein